MKHRDTGILAVAFAVLLIFDLAVSFKNSHLVIEQDYQIQDMRNQITDLQKLSAEDRKKLEEANKIVAKKIAFDQSVNCLAQNMYYEAAYEPEEGQIAVAQVTMNRTHDINYPKTVCGVVYQPAQFTWTQHPLKRVNKSVFSKIVVLAKRILTKKQVPVIVESDVTLYHASYVHPEWADQHPVAAVIGNHIFYKREKVSTVE